MIAFNRNPLPDASSLIARTRATWIVPFLIGLASISGCALFDSGGVSPLHTAVDFEARTLDNPRLKAFIESTLHREMAEWPPASWDFTTLTLAAYYYHPDLDMARARWAEAKAAVKTASRLPNPSADSRYQYVSNPEVDTPSSVSDSTLLFPIEAPGKRRHRIARAEHLSEAARLDIVKTAWQVRSRVRSSMIGLCEAQQTAALLRDGVSLQVSNAALIERRMAAGEVSPLEAMKAHAALADSLLALAQGRKQLADARVQLASALGVPSPGIETIRISFGLDEDRDIDFSTRDLQHRALRGRPDIMAALEEYAASQSALQIELAARCPDIQLGPGFEWDQGLDKWGIAGSMPLPLFDRNAGPIAEARARREAAAARFTALQAQVIGEIDQALAARDSARRERDAADSLLREQERRLAFLQAMTHPGEVQQVAIFNARQQLNAAALSKLSAGIKVQRAFAQIEDAVQGSLIPYDAPPPTAETNPRLMREY